jgi:hypothetical protein
MMGKILILGLLLVALAAATPKPAPDVDLRVTRRGGDVILAWTPTGISPAHGVYRVYRGDLKAPFNRWTLIGKTDRRTWTDQGAARHHKNFAYKVQYRGAP